MPRPALANGQALCTPDTRWEAIRSVTSRSSGRHSADLLPHNFWREGEKAFSSLPLFVANATSLLTAPFREGARAGHGAPRGCRVVTPFPTLTTAQAFLPGQHRAVLTPVFVWRAVCKYWPAVLARKFSWLGREGDLQHGVSSGAHLLLLHHDKAAQPSWVHVCQAGAGRAAVGPHRLVLRPWPVKEEFCQPRQISLAASSWG